MLTLLGPFPLEIVAKAKIYETEAVTFDYMKKKNSKHSESIKQVTDCKVPTHAHSPARRQSKKKKKKDEKVRVTTDEEASAEETPARSRRSRSRGSPLRPSRLRSWCKTLAS